MASQNELDSKAHGGTELLGERLERLVDPGLLKDFQIIRSRFRGFDETKKYHVFWEHDLPGDPESQQVFNNIEIMNRFNAIVFVSNWQKNAFLDAFPMIPKGKCLVIRNGIDPVDTSLRGISKKTNKVRLIYTPTPHRGLEILVPVFEKLDATYPGVFHLDVYSSFKLYGWEERDKPYQDLFERVKTNSSMTYHGTVSNDEIRKALLMADIFAYPSIWQETSCLCLIEAMSAGCACVCSDLAAIPETSGSLIFTYPHTGDFNQDAQSLYLMLHAVGLEYMKGLNVMQAQLEFAKFYCDWLHSTNRMKVHWDTLLSTISNNR